MISIPPSVRRLSLALNQLGEKKVEHLEKAFRAISSAVHVLDLQKNVLHRLTIEKLNVLKGSLPFITTIYLTSGEINRMSYTQLDAFAHVLPACQQIVAINRLNKIVLSEKIKYLQSKINPSSVYIPSQLQKANQLLDGDNHYNVKFLLDSEITDDKWEKTNTMGFFRHKALPEPKVSELTNFSALPGY